MTQSSVLFKSSPRDSHIQPSLRISGFKYIPSLQLHHSHLGLSHTSCMDQCNTSHLPAFICSPSNPHLKYKARHIMPLMASQCTENKDQRSPEGHKALRDLASAALPTSSSPSPLTVLRSPGLRPVPQIPKSSHLWAFTSSLLFLEGSAFRLSFAGLATSRAPMTPPQRGLLRPP